MDAYIIVHRHILFAQNIFLYKHILITYVDIYIYIYSTYAYICKYKHTYLFIYMQYLKEYSGSLRICHFKEFL